MSSATFYKWCNKRGGMGTSMLVRLKELEDETPPPIEKDVYY